MCELLCQIATGRFEVPRQLQRHEQTEKVCKELKRDIANTYVYPLEVKLVSMAAPAAFPRSLLRCRLKADCRHVVLERQ